MEILFLGTSSMVPTKERNQSGLLVSHGSENILVDCGEGTQRQLKIAGIKLVKISKILISHWHGDHVLGIPGLIQTMSSSDYDKKLRIYGPAGTKKFMKKMFEAFVFDKKIDIEVKEIKKGKFFESDELVLEAQLLEHNVTTLGFNILEKDKRKIDLASIKNLGIPKGPLLGELQDGKSIVWKGKKIRPDEATVLVKGKKLTIISDTLPCNGSYLLAKDADLLVCESTYASDLESKGEEHGHMTSKQAAELANRAGVKRLVLTHFSARYKDTNKLEEDAKDYFYNVSCAEDFMKIVL